MQQLHFYVTQDKYYSPFHSKRKLSVTAMLSSEHVSIGNYTTPKSKLNMESLLQSSPTKSSAVLAREG